MTRPDVITGPGQLPRAHLRWIIFRSVCGSAFAAGQHGLWPGAAAWSGPPRTPSSLGECDQNW